MDVHPPVHPGEILSKITSIDPRGFWLLADDSKYFVPFTDYPIFWSASVDQIFAFERLSLSQFHWPDLDADIELDALEHPEQYPLVWRS